jgi:hypothetical protein
MKWKRFRCHLRYAAIIPLLLLSAALSATSEAGVPLPAGAAVPATATKDDKSCADHFVACQEANRRRGFRWGHSHCRECMMLCQGEGHWPSRLANGKSCEYWKWDGR